MCETRRIPASKLPIGATPVRIRGKSQHSDSVAEGAEKHADGLDERCAAFLVLLDVSAGFDTTNHGILLAHLQSWFGIGGFTFYRLASYVSYRVQRVHITGVSSTERAR